FDIFEADVKSAIEQRADFAGERDGLRGAGAGTNAEKLVRHRHGVDSLRVSRERHADRVVLHVRGDDHALDQMLMLNDLELVEDGIDLSLMRGRRAVENFLQLVAAAVLDEKLEEKPV